MSWHVDNGIVTASSQDAIQHWRADVDRRWAEVLRMAGAAVRSGGVFALDHVDHVGVIAVEGATALIVYGPPQALPALNAAVQGEDGDASDAHRLAAVLGPRTRRVLGPAWYGYARAQTLGPLQGQAVRPLGELDLPLSPKSQKLRLNRPIHVSRCEVSWSSPIAAQNSLWRPFAVQGLAFRTSPPLRAGPAVRIRIARCGAAAAVACGLASRGGRCR